MKDLKQQIDEILYVNKVGIIGKEREMVEQTILALFNEAVSGIIGEDMARFGEQASDQWYFATGYNKRAEEQRLKQKEVLL